MALRLAQDLDAPDRAGRGSATAASRGAPTGPRRFDAGPVEQVGAELDSPVDAGRGGVAGTALGEADGQVELGGGEPTGSRRVTSPGRSMTEPARGVFCKTSITWNNGWRDSDRAGFNTSTRRSKGRS